MAETLLYRHVATNKVKRSDNPVYMARAGFVEWDGEVEIDKTGAKTADLSIDDLRALADAAGVSKGGSKADIQQRLLEAYIAQRDGTTTTPTTPPETPGAVSGGAADSSSTPAGEDSETPQKEG